MRNGLLKSFAKTFLKKYQTLHLDYPVDMKPRYTAGKPHVRLKEIIDRNRTEYKSWLQKAMIHAEQLSAIPDMKDRQSAHLPAWNNGFLPGYDVAMLYTFLAELKPETYIEIGSGNSTKIVHQAKIDHQLQTRIVSIDPAPRAEIDDLVDEVIRQPVEATGLNWIRELKAGDIVFVDNSHRLLPNSDVMVVFLEILPALPPGVIVHIHDVYLPYDYPQEMCDRAYSEQYMLAAILMANPEKYTTLMPAYYVSQDNELSRELKPLWQMPGMPVVEQHGGSYWFQINS